MRFGMVSVCTFVLGIRDGLALCEWDMHSMQGLMQLPHKPEKPEKPTDPVDPVGGIQASQ